MLRVENLLIPPVAALSFEVRPGECLGLEGRSGAGKSRLLRALADLEPSTGDVTFEGARRDETRAPDWRRMVRYLPAESGWWAPTALDHAPHGPAGQKFQRLMAALEIDSVLQTRPLETLSTGERRRIAIALALADEPRCLLLDEPTSGLDPVRTALVDELIRYQLLAGRVVVLASHDQVELGRLADRRLQLTPPDDRAPDHATPALTRAPAPVVSLAARGRR